MKYVNQLSVELINEIKQEMEQNGYDQQDITMALDSKVYDLQDTVSAELFNKIK